MRLCVYTECLRNEIAIHVALYRENIESSQSLERRQKTFKVMRDVRVFQTAEHFVGFHKIE
jgi:hypothetical protein